MNRDLLTAQLRGLRLGRHLECHSSLESTNDRAKALLERKGAKAHGAVVIADEQTQGRGRQGRAWHHAPGKGLAMSLALWPAPGAALECLPLAGALAVRRGLSAYGLEARLKWPNDVVVNDAKLAGILVEGRFSGDRPRGCVLGIGVNLNEKEEDFPPDLDRKATSVLIRTGRAVVREEFAALLLKELDVLLHTAMDEPAALVEACRPYWRHRPGEPLSVVTERATLEGTFAGVGPGGELLLAGAGGVREVRYGDVVRLGGGEEE